MYFNNAQIATLSKDNLNSALVVFIDYTDSLSHHDYVDGCSPSQDLADAFLDIKTKIWDLYRAKNFANLNASDLPPDLVLHAVNMAFDLSDGDSYGDYRDSTAGDLTDDQYNGFRNAISAIYRTTI